MRAKHIILFLGILLCFNTQAQVIITPSQLPQGQYNVDKPIQFQINNTQLNTVSGQLKLRILDGEKPLAEITYQQITLSAGLQNINTADLAKNNENFTDKNLQASRTISQGQIQLCVDFISTTDNTILGNHCSQLLLSSNQENKKAKSNLPINFTGYAEISGNYSNRQGSFQTLPTNYTNVIVNPQLEVFGIPIGARANYSTASNKNLQNMNFINVYFDASRFKQNLDKKYLQNLGQDYLLEKTNVGDYAEKAKELDKLNKILNNPFIAGELAKIDRLDSLDKLMQDSSVYFKSDKIAAIKKQQDSLGYLNEKREAYQSLQQKQKSLAQLIGIYQNPMDLGVLKDSLGVLEKQLQTTREPFSLEDEHRLNSIDSLLSDSSSNLSKSRREVLKQQRDRLKTAKKAKDEHEALKEKYSTLHHTYEYKNKLDSIRGQRKDYTSILSKDSAKNLLKDPSKIKDKYAFLKAFKSINVGFFAPYTGELTLNGVPIRGGGAELEFKKVFLGFASGKQQRTTGFVNENSSPTASQRNLTSAWVGFGKQGRNFISFQYIDAKDIENTPQRLDSGVFFTNNQGHNKVVSSQFMTTFFKGRTTIKGEIAGSQLITPSASVLIENQTGTAPESSWLTNILNQTNGNGYRTGYGYNVSVTQQLNNANTTLTATSKKTSPTYISFGSPFILTDIYTNEARLTQKLWQGKAVLTGFYRTTSDNLNNLKTFTTQNKNFGGDFSLRVPNWPTLRVMYMPMIQQTPGNYFSSNMLTANSTYGLKNNNNYHQWTALYTQQTSSSRIGYNNFNTKSYTINYLFTHKQKLNANMSLNRIEQYSTTTIKGFMGSIAIGYIYKKKLNQQIGATLTDNSLGNRKSLFYELNHQFTENLALRIRYERTNYSAVVTQTVLANDFSYKENLLIFSLIKRW